MHPIIPILVTTAGGALALAAFDLFKGPTAAAPPAAKVPAPATAAPSAAKAPAPATATPSAAKAPAPATAAPPAAKASAPATAAPPAAKASAPAAAIPWTPEAQKRLDEARDRAKASARGENFAKAPDSGMDAVYKINNW